MREARVRPSLSLSQASVLTGGIAPMPLKGELAGGDLVPVAARSVLCRSVQSGLHKFSLTLCGTGARSPPVLLNWAGAMTDRDGVNSDQLLSRGRTTLCFVTRTQGRTSCLCF